MRRWLLVPLLVVLGCDVSSPPGKPDDRQAMNEVPEAPLTDADLGRPWIELYVPEGAPDAGLVRHPGGFAAVSRAFEGGGKVITGVYSYLYRSADGVRWQRVPLERGDPAWFGFRDLAYGGGRFVLAGSGSTSNELWTSTDLVTWTVTPVSGLMSWGLSEVTWAQGRFFAFSSQQHLFTSTDGTAWQSVFLEGTVQSRAVAYGAGRFVRVGGGAIHVSSDGLAWSPRPVDCALPGACITDPGGGVHQQHHGWVVYADGKFYVDQLTSPDGDTWSAHAAPSAEAFVGGVFLATQVVDDQLSVRAWREGQPPQAVSLTPASAPGATFVSGLSPAQIDATPFTGESCLTHRCVVVGHRLFLIR